MHRLLKEYVCIKGVNSMARLFDLSYTKFCEEIKAEPLEQRTWYRYMAGLYSYLKIKGKSSDCCNTCIRLQRICKDPKSTKEEIALAKLQLAKHTEEARAQRVGMTTAIKLWGRHIPNFESAIDRVPEALEGEGSLPLDSDMSPLSSPCLVLCEDYAGNRPFYAILSFARTTHTVNSECQYL